MDDGCWKILSENVFFRCMRHILKMLYDIYIIDICYRYRYLIATVKYAEV